MSENKAQGWQIVHADERSTPHDEWLCDGWIVYRKTAAENDYIGGIMHKAAAQDLQSKLRTLEADNAALRERVRVLEDGLKKYGQHPGRCNTNDPFYGLPCSCGLSALLSPAAATEGGEG